jgi:hypothetical protein
VVTFFTFIFINRHKKLLSQDFFQQKYKVIDS